ncbi:hypothetical protein [Bordetella bronchiseptica]|uniref:hypothetical protein n=1 Tax=Bordetella bronchiseptica TaxID=518 RepID=UPI000528172D|nr:hypothetical protein [Bordetella bronchiseptica]
MRKRYQVALLLLFLGLCIVLAKYWPSSSTDWASWVQAIGSIGAIVGAFQIALTQARESDRVRKKQDEIDRLDRSNLGTAIAIDAASAVRDSSDALKRHKEGAAFSPELDRLEEARFMIRSFLPTRCPPEMAVDMIRMQRVVVYSLRALRQRQGSKESFNSKTRESADKRANDAKEIMLKFAAARNTVRDRQQG